jgi:hypothetical protein
MVIPLPEPYRNDQIAAVAVVDRAEAIADEIVRRARASQVESEARGNEVRGALRSVR